MVRLATVIMVLVILVSAVSAATPPAKDNRGGVVYIGDENLQGTKVMIPPATPTCEGYIQSLFIYLLDKVKYQPEVNPRLAMLP